MKFIFLIEQKDVVAILIVILNEWQINKMMRQQIAATSILGNKKNRLLWLQRSKEWKENSSNVSVIFWFCNFSLTRYSQKIYGTLCVCFVFVFTSKFLLFCSFQKIWFYILWKMKAREKLKLKRIGLFYIQWMNE